MRKIAVVTSIKPDRLNRGGPSGLIWEIIEVLKSNKECEINIFIEEEATSLNVQRLHRLGIYLKKNHTDFSSYDNILVYPDYIYASIPKEYYYKIIVLGPDSTSLVFKRYYRIATGIKKIQYFLYYKWYIRAENIMLKNISQLIVVGINDRRWIRFHMRNKKLADKVTFMRHPLLSGSLHKNFLIENKFFSNKRFVFSGDLNKRYVGNFINQISELLKQRQIKNNVYNLDILIVGRFNKWIFHMLKNIDGINAEYMEWVDNYQEICQIGRDVHCVPLMAGGGTKNRVLTAIANGIEVITTPIGIENIIREGVMAIYIAKTPAQFINTMLKIENKFLDERDREKLVLATDKYRERVSNEFQDCLKDLFG